MNSSPDKYVSVSMLYMWRCVVAMAHADGIVHETERAYLEGIFGNMKRARGLTDEQMAILRADLETPQDVADLLRYINEPSFRGQVVFFARLLAMKDGDLHPAEETLLNKLHANAMDAVNMKEIRALVHENVTKEMIAHEIEKDSLRPNKGLSGLIDNLLLFFGIDLMDE